MGRKIEARRIHRVHRDPMDVRDVADRDALRGVHLPQGGAADGDRSGYGEDDGGLGAILHVFGPGTSVVIERGWPVARSEEHTSELQSLMRRSYAVFCLKKKTITLYHVE